ncbi:MAG: nucleoside triphosphate pyrophosphohydrolase [Verrucomicrobiota bacterium]|nr:nucleoside triphosphate pyrophosphohydrolase [Verrucomicrobiota bacterium]
MTKDWLKELYEIMARLRSENGCPWDREQNHSTLKECLLEEVAEFLDTVDDLNYEEMKEELGDVLLQIFFHSRIAEENEEFNIQDVAQGICEKLIRRHPHVFGDTKVKGADEVLVNWEKIKQTENSPAYKRRKSLVDGIPRHLPALHRAHKIQKKAAKTGFNWRNSEEIIEKIEEELLEVKSAIKEGNNRKIDEEIGDLLFAVVNLSRYRKTLAEELLHSTVKKFSDRFKAMEKLIKQENKAIEEIDIDTLKGFWEKAKNTNGEKIRL